MRSDEHSLDALVDDEGGSGVGVAAGAGAIVGVVRGEFLF